MEQKIQFYYSVSFNKYWKKAGLTEADKKDLEKKFRDFAQKENTHLGKRFLGNMIQGTDGAIKYRYSSENSNKGKSGSERVIYLILSGTNYYFIDIYGKNEKDSLSDKEKAVLKNLTTQLKKYEKDLLKHENERN